MEPLWSLLEPYGASWSLLEPPGPKSPYKDSSQTTRLSDSLLIRLPLRRGLFKGFIGRPQDKVVLVVSRRLSRPLKGL